jgi:hypothetical protein
MKVFGWRGCKAVEGVRGLAFWILALTKVVVIIDTAHVYSVDCMADC